MYGQQICKEPHVCSLEVHTISFIVSPTRAQTTVEPVSIAPRGSVTCFSCGQPGVDPHADNPGSYCDVTIETNICPATSKIYNFTCDIMDRMGRSGHWER